MNSIRKEARKVPFTNDYYKNENEKNITNVEECFHVDLYKVKPEELNFEKKIALHCVHDNTNLDAIVGEFRCKFNLPNFIDFEVNNKILDEKVCFFCSDFFLFVCFVFLIWFFCLFSVCNLFEFF